MPAMTPLSVVVSSLVQAAHLGSPSRAPTRSDSGRIGSSPPAWFRRKAQATGIAPSHLSTKRRTVQQQLYLPAITP
jgi:hypothetical protein